MKGHNKKRACYYYHMCLNFWTRENDTEPYGQTLENPLSSMRYDGWLLIN